MLFSNNFDFPIYSSKFIRHLKRLNYSNETIKGYSKDLKTFTTFIWDIYEGSILTEELQKEDLLDYLEMLQQKGLKPNSVSRNLSILKSFYKYLVFECNFKIDIGARIKQLPIYTPLPDILTFDEIEVYLNQAKEVSNYLHTFICLLYYTGSRLTPIRTLLKKDVNLYEKRIYFPIIKNGRDLHLPLNERMYEILNNHIFETKHNGSDYVFNSNRFCNKPISAADVRVKMKQIAKLAGIQKRITPHIIRHCTATHLTLLDVDQKYIASILGHRDLRSTSRYQHLNVENLRSTINKLGKIYD